MGDVPTMVKKKTSAIGVGDCVVMRAPYRKYITSSTGGDVFKVVAISGKALTIEGPVDYHPKHRQQKVMGAQQFKRVACPRFGDERDGQLMHHSTKKTPAQLDREIAEVVPGWARGLDLSESRRLAATLHMTQEDLERKARVAQSDRRAKLPLLRINARTGKEPGSTVTRGVYIYVSSPGIAYGNVHSVANALRADGERVTQIEPRYVRVAADTDPDSTARRAAEALRDRGYRVEIGHVK
jgi:hypothetical protein